ncbi:MAG: hypothetical protein ACTSX1_07030 [Candidatus Heimdallarchaeaceae archaeon]
MRRFVVVLVVIGIFLSSSLAETKKQIVLPARTKDGLKNIWVVNNDGCLTSRPDPYKWACILYVDGIKFPNHESAILFIREKGKEVVIGPTVMGSVTVTRKIYFGKGEGHVRFVEVFENTTTTPVTINVELKSISKCWKQLPFRTIWENDECIVVYYPVASAHNFGAVEFIYGSGGRFKPRRDERSELSYSWNNLPIQPQSKVVILHFCAVRPQRKQALEFAQSFQVAPACVEMDPSDLSSIVNYDPAKLGAKTGIEILRGKDKDIALLKSGDKLTGMVQETTIRIQTSYALLEFPTEKIATIIYEGGVNNIERIILLNGDVFSGFILDSLITLKLEAGPIIKIRKEKISKLGFHIRSNERKKYPVHHDITLTNGDHFSGIILNEKLTIKAAFGDMTIPTNQIAKIDFISKRGTVTNIILKNGDKVSGFLKDEDIKIKLDFGGKVSIYQDRFEKIIFDVKALEKALGKKK